MKKLATAVITAFYSLSTFLGLTAMIPATVHAADAKPAPAKTQTAAKSVVYNYVAQKNDSFSKLARKAAQTYSVKNKIKLSNAKVLAAETWLTQDAGSPRLAVGQKVAMPESTVKAAVDKAVKLSAAKEAAWNAYTAGVNFNTNAVGQSK